MHLGELWNVTITQNCPQSFENDGKYYSQAPRDAQAPQKRRAEAGGMRRVVSPAETEKLCRVGTIVESQPNLGWKGAQAWGASGSATAQGQAGSIWHVIISLIGSLMSPLPAASPNLFRCTSPEHRLVAGRLFEKYFLRLFYKQPRNISWFKIGGEEHGEEEESRSRESRKYSPHLWREGHQHKSY